MSQQLRFSATVSVLTMALFALTMSVGGAGLADAAPAASHLPTFAATSIGE